MRAANLPAELDGRCGKNLTGTTELDRKTGKRFVVYFCSSYKMGRSNGQPSKCMAYRITHADAEKLLLDKIKEQNIEFDTLRGEMVRSSMNEKLSQVNRELLHTEIGKTMDLEVEGIDAMVKYYQDNYDVAPKALQAFREKADDYYSAKPMKRLEFSKRLRDIAQKAEQDCVERATKKVKMLTDEHEKITLALLGGTEKQKVIWQRRAEILETEMKEWEPKTRSISNRLYDLIAQGNQLVESRQSLLKELPALYHRERGEALRRVFKTVMLFWKSKFREPEANPKRERTTDRKRSMVARIVS